MELDGINYNDNDIFINNMHIYGVEYYCFNFPNEFKKVKRMKMNK